MIRLQTSVAIRSLEKCLKITRPSAYFKNKTHQNSGTNTLRNSVILPKSCSIHQIQQSYFSTGSQNFARGTRQAVSLSIKPRETSDSPINGASPDTLPNTESSHEVTIQEDFPLPVIPKSSKDEEIYEGIMKMKPKEIFYLLQHHHEDLNKTHFALSMKRLYRIYRNLPVESREDYKTLLHQQDGFKLLCALLALKGEHYEPSIVADMLIFIHELGLDGLNPTIQVYLQLLSHNLHRLTLDVILKVMRSSVTMTTTPQVNLIQEGIKILAEKGQLTSGIEVLSTSELVNMLDLLGGWLPKDDRKKLLKEVSLAEDDISPRLSVVLLRGLRHLGSPHYLEVETVRKLRTKIEKLDSHEVIQVLEACWDIELYNFELLNRIEKESIEKFGSQDQFTVLKWLYKFGYLPKRLLPTILNDLEHLGQLFRTLESKDFLELLAITSDASHKVEIHQEAKQLLVSRLHEMDFVELSSEDILHCLTNLHVMGHSDLDLVNELHALLDKDEALQQFRQSKTGRHTIDHPLWRLHLLTVVRNNTESLLRLEPHNNEVLNESSIPSHTDAMGRMISTALEMENSVITRPTSRDRMIIDHVIVTDEYNQPFDLSEKLDVLLEDWNLPENYKIVSVMELPDVSFHRNTRQLRAFYAWYMRQLQAKGHLVVLINTELFNSIEDGNRYEYIRRKIFSAEKFQDLILLS